MQNNTIKKLKYPVIVIGPNYKFDLISNKTPFSFASKLSLKKGFMENWTVYDYNGESYLIQKVIKKERVKNFFNQIALFNPMYKVELSIDKIKEPVELIKFKRKIEKVIENSKGYWDDITHVESLKEKLNKAKSIQEMIDLLKKPNEDY